QSSDTKSLDKVETENNGFRQVKSLKGDGVQYDYGIWEVFYFDERGNRDNEKVFPSENEACEYIFENFKEQKAIEKKYH
ncbi:MAG: hypothetical protein R2766_01890, partial [Saprospiraceae bacterium]